jgi:hypothetical protein
MNSILTLQISDLKPPMITNEMTKPIPTTEEILTFTPETIYYEGTSGKYLVDVGNYFRTYGSKPPVMVGLERYYLANQHGADEAKSAATLAIKNTTVDHHVEWSGNLAGHKKGLFYSSDGKPMLVLTSPSLATPVRGPAPVITDLIQQALPDQVQRDVLIGWLAGFYRAVRSGVHHPAPMLCLAGKPNSGKSLLSYLVKCVVGGRSANPHTAWSGTLPWNDDLCAAELLLLDDCQGSTDIRTRMNFASNFKASIYAGDITMNKRNTSSISVRPVWRVMVCCNDTPESLLILPPITSDMSDKVILLKMETITPPVDTSHIEGREELSRLIREEIPMLLHYLDKFELPTELKDSRSGVRAWRHPQLTQAMESLKPENQFEELLAAAFGSYLWDDLPRVMTASEVDARLTHRDSMVRDQVRILTSKWSGACGSYLTKLAEAGSEFVGKPSMDTHRKINKYPISR